MIPMVNLEWQHEPITTELRLAISTVLSRAQCYILGPAVEEFEREWAAYCGVDHCIGCANGTDALYLALVAVGVKAGDRVITVANAGGYATSAIKRVGAIPHYLDIDPQTLLIDFDSEWEQTLASSWESVQSGNLINPEKIKAVIVTHLYGSMVDVNHIREKFRGPIIEDCAHAHGAMLNGQRAGSLGDIGCFSFYPTKNLGAIGDAGALTTNNPEYAARLRQLRQYGWTRKYEAAIPGGINSRMDELQAAVLSVKLRYLEGSNFDRRRIVRNYRRGINNPDIAFSHSTTNHIFHQFVVMVHADHRDSLRAHLFKHGIASDIHYPIPDHHQVAWSQRANLPNTVRACLSVLSIPCYPELTDGEVEQVIDACNSWSP